MILILKWGTRKRDGAKAYLGSGGTLIIHNILLRKIRGQCFMIKMEKRLKEIFNKEDIQVFRISKEINDYLQLGKYSKKLIALGGFNYLINGRRLLIHFRMINLFITNMMIICII